jgi:hypothetical protein
MAHFAKINEANIVEQVIVVSNDVITDSNGVEQESLGIEFCKKSFGGKWIQTSYNANFRGICAFKAARYDAENDIFVDDRPNNGIIDWEMP